MNVDAILKPFANRGVTSILIGGMNFLLRHKPVLTFDVDLWIRDEEANRILVAKALGDLGAEWGRDDQSWGPVSEDPGWLKRQNIYCLTTAHGALDIFREVRGLEGRFEECLWRARSMSTASGVPFLSLSDADMLACQWALPEVERKKDRVEFLNQVTKEDS